jgi:hypothetical protein
MPDNQIRPQWNTFTGPLRCHCNGIADLSLAATALGSRRRFGPFPASRKPVASCKFSIELNPIPSPDFPRNGALSQRNLIRARFAAFGLAATARRVGAPYPVFLGRHARGLFHFSGSRSDSPLMLRLGCVASGTPRYLSRAIALVIRSSREASESVKRRKLWQSTCWHF